MSDIEKLKELLPFSKNLNILFAEDNEDVRAQIVKMLNNFFENIDIAVDGLDALNLYSEKSYDIVITDLSMPNLDGISLCKEIMSIDQDQIILVISAYTHPDNLFELINLGITKFIQKPIEQENIIKTLLASIELCKNGNSRF